jgi:hypothetical protein
VISRIVLEPEQEQLFCDFVEAERRVPRANRSHFIITKPLGAPGVCLFHPGWIERNRRVFEGDIDTLIRAGLLSASDVERSNGFYVSSEGFRYYGELMRSRGQPMQRVEQFVREYVQSSTFQARYPTAYTKWGQAESLLWADDSDKAFTTIGHLLREAIQEFASALVDRLQPPNVEANKAKTVARIRAVLSTCKLSDKVSEFLDALLAYWGTISDLVQRQEHGALREGEALTWLDARRVVFQVAIVMLDIDATLTD